MLSEVTAEEAQQGLKTLHACFAGSLEETIEKASEKEMESI